MRKRLKTTLFSFIAVLSGIGAAFIALEIALRVLPVGSGMKTMAADDANPIVRFTPNRDFTFSNGFRKSSERRAVPIQTDLSSRIRR